MLRDLQWKSLMSHLTNFMGKLTLDNTVSDVRTVVKNKTGENKHTTSETSNLESGSSSYSTHSENFESKVNMKTGQTNKLSAPSGLERGIQNSVSSTSTDSLRPKSGEKVAQLQTASMDVKSESSSGNADNDIEKSSHNTEYENSKVSVGNQKEIASQSQKKEMGTDNDGGNLPEEDLKPSKPQEQGVEEDASANLNVKDSPADDSDESDIVEHDVKVCDICGDAGREDLLAICCRCIDGAEHTYCMKVMIDEVPEGDWLCEECKAEEENKNTVRQRYGLEVGSEKAQSSGQTDSEPRSNKDHSVAKVSGKRRLEESESFSAVKKQALEVNRGSPRLHSHADKDVDRGKVKSSHQLSSDSSFGNESSDAARSPAKRPHLQSLRGSFMKSNSFNYPNSRSKTKLVDEIVLQRQKSTKERSSHDPIVPKDLGKSMSFRSPNLGRLGAASGGSRVKMLSPNSSQVQDPKSLKNKKERTFERNNSVKSSSMSNLSTSSSTALTPKGDKLPSTRGDTTQVSSVSNSEVKPLKGENKMTSGPKSTIRSSNIGSEAPGSTGQNNKQLPSSPTRIGNASSSGTIGSTEQKSVASKDENSSKVAISKDLTNLADGNKETTTTTSLNPATSNVTSQNHKHSDRPVSVGANASVRAAKDLKNRDTKLKDAIEAALLKKPGIYSRKNRVSDQPDESSVSTTNNEVSVADRTPHSRNASNLTSTDVLNDWQGLIPRNSNIDHSKQSNGKHSTIELLSHDAISSLLKSQPIPDQDYIWQGGFEINRSGKTAEFWDGLQAHLSSRASPKVHEAVSNLPHKISLNGVSRASAWPKQFENNGVKEDNIALYFFAKDLESYEKSYQVLLDDMIRGDLALIGSIGGVELLIFPSNQLPEKSNRWNMLFFLWGVLRGKRKSSLPQVPNLPEKNTIPQVVTPIETDRISSAEPGSLDKDKHVDSESKGESKLQTFSQEKPINNTSSPVDNLNVVPDLSLPNKSDDQNVVKYTRNPKVEQRSIATEVPSEEQNHSEPKKRPFIDLSDDVDLNKVSTWDDGSDQMAEEDSVSKKQKSDDFFDKSGVGNSNGERFFFPVESMREVKEEVAPKKYKLALDLNEDISCLVGEAENTMMTKEDDVASSLSLSLSFSHADKDGEDRAKGGRNSTTPSMLLFRDIVDK